MQVLFSCTTNNLRKLCFNLSYADLLRELTFNSLNVGLTMFRGAISNVVIMLCGFSDLILRGLPLAHLCSAWSFFKDIIAF